MDPASTTTTTSRRAPPAAAGRPPPEFPAGLRVLLVDDDATCLKIIGTMLRKCLYDVTTCSRAVQALSLLRERKERCESFDLVLSDVYMPDMDGFKLLEHIGLEMDLPVIMMSADDHKDVVMKGVTHGAVDYLIKPVRMELLKNIWQHVVRKKKKFELKDAEQSGSTEENDRQKKALEDGDNVTSGSGGSSKIVKRKKENKDEEEDDEDTEEREDPSHTKKPRVVWSVELHQQFMTAVNQLGIDKAVPKRILELMKVPGLTRENVASHLQKYRLYLRRVSGPQHEGGPYTSAQEARFQSGGVESFDLQALAASGQLLPALQPGARRGMETGIGMPPFDQLGFLSSTTGANASNTRMPSVYQMSHRGLSYFPGSSNCIESRQIGQPYNLAEPHGRNTSLKVEEETAVFFNTPSSQSTRSLLPGAITNEQLNRSLLVHMSQPRQQFSRSQQHGNFLGQAISRGQVLNGASSHDSRLSSTVRQQLSSEILNNVSGRTPSILNTSLPGNQISSLYASVHQPLNTNIQNTSMNESAAPLYPFASSIGAAPMTGNVEASSKTSSWKGVSDLPTSCDAYQSKTQDWKSQNSNLSYLSGQQIGSNPNNQSSLATHQDRNTLNTCTVRKEILSVRTEIEHEKVGCISQHNSAILIENSVRLKSEVMPDTNLQDAFYDDNIMSNELMNVVGKQFQEGTEDASEFFDRYSLDNM